MADKEERILIARSTDYTITDTDEGALFDGKIVPHCTNVMTRQEAIERMAKAIFKRDSVLALDIGFENLIEQKQNVYRDFAEIALNALLEENINEENL